jgi:hypothetical protein
MKGLIRKATSSLVLGCGLATIGCYGYRQHVDPCWPERYSNMAMHSVFQATDTQAANGHILDQTLWNWHFEPGKETLNPAGMEKIQYLVRRRPFPDPKVYIQTAQDIPDKNPADWDSLPAKRMELDQKRIAQVQGYLASQTGGRPDVKPFTVAVHDAHPSGVPSKIYVGYQPTVRSGSVGIGAYDVYFNNFRGTAVGAVTTAGGGGGAPGQTGQPGAGQPGQAGQPQSGGQPQGGSGAPPTN